MDATGGPMIKQARELGIKAVFAFGDGACTDEMGKLAGQAAEGLVCSQAGLPREAAARNSSTPSPKKYGEIKQYAPVLLRRRHGVIEAMKKANSTDPAKFAPEMFNVSFTGATGKVEFDAKGDRKDAEMTIFKLEGGKVKPVAIVKGGVSTPFKMAAAPPPAPAPRPGGPRRPGRPASAPAAPKEEPRKTTRRNKPRTTRQLAQERHRSVPFFLGVESRVDTLPAAGRQRADAGLRVRRGGARLHDGLRDHPAHQLRARRGGDDRLHGRLLR
jgi:branched-chain amino acid transport system substrate-binding protein